MSEIRERDIEKYLIAAVKKIGGETRKVKWIGRRGAPDRRVMIPSRAGFRTGGLAPGAIRPPMLFWAELKAPGEKLKPHQVREIGRMRLLGEHVVVIDSFEQIDRLLA